MNKKILVRAPNWLGDNIMAMPAIFALRKKFPNAHIAIMIKKTMADIWKMTPVDEIIPFNFKNGLGGIKDRFDFAKKLKNNNFDIAVILPNSFDSALVPALAKIPKRVGWATDCRSLMLTSPIKKTIEIKKQKQFLHYIYLIEKWLNQKIDADENIQLSIPERALDTLSLNFSNQKIVGLNPGSTYGSAKRWRMDYFAELAVRLNKEKNVDVVIIGGAGDKKVCDKIFDKIIHKNNSANSWCKNLAGDTSLFQLAALLKKCACLVTNDTGAMHVAAAVGTSVVAIYGPTDWASTPPLGKGHRLIKTNVKCAPCLKRTCYGDHSCMKTISVDEVFKATVDFLD